MKVYLSNLQPFCIIDVSKEEKLYSDLSDIIRNGGAPETGVERIFNAAVKANPAIIDVIAKAKGNLCISIMPTTDVMLVQIVPKNGNRMLAKDEFEEYIRNHHPELFKTAPKPTSQQDNIGQNRPRYNFIVGEFQNIDKIIEFATVTAIDAEIVKCDGKFCVLVNRPVADSDTNVAHPSVMEICEFSENAHSTNMAEAGRIFEHGEFICCLSELRRIARV